MKYIAFIVFGLVLLSTIGYVVFGINMPMARLTIHAVRPTGTNYTCTNYLGNQQNWPFWEVAVTNNGHAPAAWFATLVLENYGRVTLGDQPTGYDSLQFSLQPGKGDSIYMLMPADSTAMWTVEVRYQSQMNASNRNSHRG